MSRVDCKECLATLPVSQESNLQGRDRGKFTKMDPINANKINRALVGGKNTTARREAKKEKTAEINKEVKAEVKKITRRARNTHVPNAALRGVMGMDAGLGPAQKVLAARSNNKAVIDVFNTTVMPGVGKTIRIGDEFGAKPTAVASLFDREDTSFLNDNGNSSQRFVFRSALRFALTESTGAAYAAESITYTNTALLTVPTTNQPAYYCATLHSGSGGPHGGSLYPGRLGPSDPFYGYLANKGDRFTVSVPAAAIGSVLHVTIFQFTAKEWLSINTESMVGAASVSFDILSTNYYAFSISSPVIGTGPSFAIQAQLDLITATVDPAVPCWTQSSLPGLAQNIDTIQNIKFHGISCMWTQTSNMLARAGQIAMMQVPAGSWWGNYVGYSNVTSRNTHVEGNLNADLGAYLFLKPSGIQDFEYTNEIVPQNQINNGLNFPNVSGNDPVSNAWFYILPTSDFITIALDIPAPAGSDSRTGYWTARTDIEYSSVDQWRSLQLPTIKKEVLEEALALVCAAPQFHTNEFHLSDLWNWVKSAARSVGTALVDYGPSVVKTAAAVLPFLV